MKGISTIIAAIIVVVVTIGLIIVAYSYLLGLIWKPLDCWSETKEIPCCFNLQHEEMCYVDNPKSFTYWKEDCVETPKFTKKPVEICREGINCNNKDLFNVTCRGELIDIVIVPPADYTGAHTLLTKDQMKKYDEICGKSKWAMTQEYKKEICQQCRNSFTKEEMEC